MCGNIGVWEKYYQVGEYYQKGENGRILPKYYQPYGTYGPSGTYGFYGIWRITSGNSGFSGLYGLYGQREWGISSKLITKTKSGKNLVK